MKKYLLAPGYVRSRSDGEIHYITGPDLARLYGVPLDECVNMILVDDFYGYDPNQFIVLRPREDENYTLSKK